MTDQSRDRIDGKADEVSGRVRSALGELTGDDDTRAEGDAEHAGGKVKQGVADIRDKADDLVNKVTGS